MSNTGKVIASGGQDSEGQQRSSDSENTRGAGLPYSRAQERSPQDSGLM